MARILLSKDTAVEFLPISGRTDDSSPSHAIVEYRDGRIVRTQVYTRSELRALRLILALRVPVAAVASAVTETIRLLEESESVTAAVEVRSFFFTPKTLREFFAVKVPRDHRGMSNEESDGASRIALEVQVHTVAGSIDCLGLRVRIHSHDQRFKEFQFSLQGRGRLLAALDETYGEVAPCDPTGEG